MPEQDFKLVSVREIDRRAICDFAAAVWGELARQEVLGRWWVQSDFAAATAAVAPTGEVAAVCVGVPSEWELPGSGTHRTISICGWYVAPAFSGRGLGKMLVRRFADEASCLNALAISEAAIRNFTKLGWVGPYRTYLRLLPFPLVRRLLLKRSDCFEIRSFTASAASIPQPLAEALDQIELSKPPAQLRRKRRASDWRAHLSARPNRRLRFHVVSAGAVRLGYFIIRGTDEEAGHYRGARLHYVSDLVLNNYDDALLRFVFSSMGTAAPATAGALLLCTSNKTFAKAGSQSGWLSEETPIIGAKLAAKAPLYMLGGGLVPFANGDIHLTFADSDVDLNL